MLDNDINQCNLYNSDLFRINIINDPKCQCGAPFEDSIHYLMECPLYQNERDCLFRNLWETHTNIETLLFGNDEINISENSMMFNKVRAYIRQTKIF
jgi:hypothetical protein